MSSERTEMRVFDSGACRNTDQGKLDFEGFLSPLVLNRFAQYMHKHRECADGTIRDSDNWQKGIPANDYMKSLLRHVMDVWLHHRGFSEVAQEPLQVALCGILFNASGYLFEMLKLNGHET